MSHYKQEHEAFIAGHNGTTFQEIAALTSIPCLVCFVREFILLATLQQKWNQNGPRGWRFLLDFTVLLVPSIIAVTVGSAYIIHICLLLGLGSVVTYYMFLKKNKIRVEHVLIKTNLAHHKTFIVWYRSVVNLMTALAILAVDFRVFPRRLAKTETYGFGGMDNGVGFFVIANAIVSPEARGKNVLRPVLNQIKQSIVACCPLLLLGIGRLISVKGTDYHEHVTEYGVHWNFFFTLAALKLTSTLIYCLVNVNHSAVVGVAVLILHQLTLSLGGLTSYIIGGVDGTGARHSILDANREGIYSIPGYLAIYIFGVAIGSSFFRKKMNLKEWLYVSTKLILIVALCTVLMVSLHCFVQPVSRRLANSTFVLWIVGNASLMMLECLVAEIAITCVHWRLSASNTMKEKAVSSEEMSNLYNLDRPITRSMTLKNSLSLPKQAGSDTHQNVNNGNGDGTGIKDRHLAKSYGIESSGHHLNQKANETLHKLQSRSATDAPVCLLEAVSFNALLFFLLANIMTGLINFLIKTIYASDVVAVAVILLYLFVLCYFTVFLKKKNICTKIW